MKSSTDLAINLSKLGVTNKAELKPKNKRKKNRKKQKPTVGKETETAVKKDVGTFKKLTNFFKSLGNSTKSCMSQAGFPPNRLYLDSRASISITFNENLLDKIDKLPNTAHIKAGGSDINLSEGGVLHNDLIIYHFPNWDTTMTRMHWQTYYHWLVLSMSIG